MQPSPLPITGRRAWKLLPPFYSEGLWLDPSQARHGISPQFPPRNSLKTPGQSGTRRHQNPYAVRVFARGPFVDIVGGAGSIPVASTILSYLFSDLGVVGSFRPGA